MHRSITLENLNSPGTFGYKPTKSMLTKVLNLLEAGWTVEYCGWHAADKGCFITVNGSEYLLTKKGKLE